MAARPATTTEPCTLEAAPVNGVMAGEIAELLQWLLGGGFHGEEKPALTLGHQHLSRLQHQYQRQLRQGPRWLELGSR